MTDRAELIADLRRTAQEIRAHNIYGWGNVIDDAIAALEAKPEPAKPLPESVEGWINRYRHAATFPTLIPIEDAQQFIATLHSQHQAELAKLNDLIHRQRDVEAQLQGEVNELEAQLTAKDAEIKQLASEAMSLELMVNSVEAAAKEQGRREALAYEPEIPAEIKGRVQAEWFWKGVLAMKQSARDAQEKK